jgi:hypothetical protein
MDPRYVRKTVENLLADLLRNPGIGRPRSFLGRYGRPLGFGIALGIGGAAGCSDSNLSPGLNPADAAPDRPVLVDAKDDGPGPADGDGTVMSPDTADGPAMADTRDALPPAPDLYGLTAIDVPPARDTRDALSPGVDGSDVTDVSPADTRDALPRSPDVYGMTIDTRDALPRSPDAYGITDRPVAVDTNGSVAIDGSKAG